MLTSHRAEQAGGPGAPGENSQRGGHLALFLEAWRRGLLEALWSSLLEGDLTFHWEVCGGLRGSAHVTWGPNPQMGPFWAGTGDLRHVGQ